MEAFLDKKTRALHQSHMRAHGINDAPLAFAFLMAVVILIGVACLAMWYFLPVATTMH